MINWKSNCTELKKKKTQKRNNIKKWKLWLVIQLDNISITRWGATNNILNTQHQQYHTQQELGSNRTLLQYLCVSCEHLSLRIIHFSYSRFFILTLVISASRRNFEPTYFTSWIWFFFFNYKQEYMWLCVVFAWIISPYTLWRWRSVLGHFLTWVFWPHREPCLPR